LGIGIAYGEAEFAYFPGKAEGVVYTPVGETVNLAARLESIAGKYYEFETGKQELASIVVSGTVLDQVKEDFRCEKYEPTFVRGIQFPQRIGGVLGPKRRRKSGSASASEV
jgi:class 3 adenylate cyclase